MTPDLEAVSAKVHENWMRAKFAAGVKSRILDTTGEELLVPYDQLSEEAKELDRGTVRTVLQAIDELSPKVKTGKPEKERTTFNNHFVKL